MEEFVYTPRWLSAEESDRWFADLVEHIDWRQEQITLYGKTHNVPRLTAWYGEKGYRYSGIYHDPAPFTPMLDRLRRSVGETTGYDYNSVLLNRYLDGTHSVGWHSDNEKEVGGQAIASVSFGGTRTFDVRRTDDHSKKMRFELGHGDLLLMRPGVQAKYQHQVPKTSRVVEPRLSLTFRLAI